MKHRAAVAMSGGVDSTVAAAVLRDAGYDVIGITLKMFESVMTEKCGGRDCVSRAASSAAVLGIRHYAKSATGIFSLKVIKPFAEYYMRGLTPNPCVECNRWVKFTYLWNIACALDCEYLATGHYAIIEERNGEKCLVRGRDQRKDQSYFLYGIKRNVLPHIIFPLGGMEKTEVRKIAGKLGVPSAASPDSQDICFIPDGNYPRFLKEYGAVGKMPGHFIDENGRFLGLHDGFYNYTVGQRRGTGVYGSTRLYVTKIIPETNEVVLGTLEKARFRRFTVSDLNMLADIPDGNFSSRVQIRYRHIPADCTVSVKGNSAEVILEDPQFAATPGQSAVFYDGDRVLGGGIITEVQY